MYLSSCSYFYPTIWMYILIREPISLLHQLGLWLCFTTMHACWYFNSSFIGLGFSKTIFTSEHYFLYSLQLARLSIIFSGFSLIFYSIVLSLMFSSVRFSYILRIIFTAEHYLLYSQVYIKLGIYLFIYLKIKKRWRVNLE